jgi:20S proteasome alpha/beta subunit
VVYRTFFAVLLPAALALTSGQQRYRALLKEMVEPNTSLSSGSCTELAAKIAGHLKEAGYRLGDDITVSVVTPRTLYNMKKDTVRLKDRADAQMLKERFGRTDKEEL